MMTKSHKVIRIEFTPICFNLTTIWFTTQNTFQMKTIFQFRMENSFESNIFSVESWKHASALSWAQWMLDAREATKAIVQF